MPDRKKKPDEHFGDIIGLFGIPIPEREVSFHPTRKWRFDYAWPDQMIAVEIQGGHQHRTSPAKDYEKLNEAQRLGWSVYQFNLGMLSSQPKREVVGEFLEAVFAKEPGDA